MRFFPRFALILFCLSVLVALLCAEEKQALPAASEKPDASMDIACSTPGIACLPKEISCEKKS
jgi:hypothetical protein